MSEASRRRKRLSGGWTVWLAGLAALPWSATAGGAEPTLDHPIVAGFERRVAEPGGNAAEAGRVLWTELNCGSCHQPDVAAAAAGLESKHAPILDAVGARVRPEYLRSFLADPQATKPGTTMPNLLAQRPVEERRTDVEALTHFLASSGRTLGIAPNPKSIVNGRFLYRRIGCVACHGPLESNEPRLATSVPLGELTRKYTLSGLTTFLSDPLKLRPSGRMPALGLSSGEAGDLAAYLLRDLRETAEPNLAYAYYEGRWENLPDFKALTPLKTGKSTGIDLTVALRKDNIGLVFEGFLPIERDGDYSFYLKSDDGSRLVLDGELAVENDGIHPMKERRGTIRMRRGTYRLTASYFNAGAEGEFELDYSGPGIPRQPIAAALSLTNTPPTSSPNRAEPRFVLNESLVERGRELFATIGCTNCHQPRRDASTPTSETATAPMATALSRLRGSEGCLSPTPQTTRAPVYSLNARQRESLAAAIAGFQAQDDAQAVAAPRAVVADAMARLNCYACHQRDHMGGVEPERLEFFQTKQKEMGDEGRLPPGLDGVGAKLTAAYLAHVVSNGAKDRPYMLTRMPRFGAANAKGLVAGLETLDSVEPVAPVAFDESSRLVKSDGRRLTGGEALGCIKCHTFNGVEAEGIQAIDMTVMSKRLRRDWFHHYLVDPQRFRPGTRMPAAWPMGQSLLPKVLGGETHRQIEAVWSFLSDGTKAAEPSGLGRAPIPLVPDKEPIIYRNFIQGAGPRGIAVGYPEKANLAFDADESRLALIWQGAFIDASRHWSARGAGFQGPLGDNVLQLPDGPGFATLATETAPWPTRTADTPVDKFRGYRLDSHGRPTFLYDLGAAPARVADLVEPDASNETAALRRRLTITSSGAAASHLWFRAATADAIEPGPDSGWYRINREWKLKIEADAEPVIRRSAGKHELLVPVRFLGAEARIVQQFVW